jgi:hypothetical protein
MEPHLLLAQVEEKYHSFLGTMGMGVKKATEVSGQKGQEMPLLVFSLAREEHKDKARHFEL